MEHTRDFRITIPLTLELDKRTALFQPRCGYVVDLEIEGTLQSTKWSNCLFVPCPAIQRSVIIQLAERGKKKKNLQKWFRSLWSVSIAIRTRRTVIPRLILEVESLSWKFQTGWNSFISANSVRWNWGAFPSLSLFLLHPFSPTLAQLRLSCH